MDFIILNINFNTQLDTENELLIYRIIQELINNVIKHANAQNLLIQLNEINNELVICIEDDGKGFDMSLNENGLGFKNIKTD